MNLAARTKLLLSARLVVHTMLSAIPSLRRKLLMNPRPHRPEVLEMNQERKMLTEKLRCQRKGRSLIPTRKCRARRLVSRPDRLFHQRLHEEKLKVQTQMQILALRKKPRKIIRR